MFTITTTDSAYTWTANTDGQVVFIPEINNQTSDTQGNLRKVQKGTLRNRAVVRIEMTNSAFDNTLAPMLEYPSDVNVTFERYIPKRNTNQGRFTFENMRPTEDTLQFDSSNEGTGEFFLDFVEVIR
jgi:hypothetical protein